MNLQSENVCRVDANNVESESPSGAEQPQNESPPSLHELIYATVQAIREQNTLLMQIVAQNSLLINQNASLIEGLAADGVDPEAPPTHDLEGNRIF